MLTDGQVGIFKDRSAAAMSTFGDILPAQAAGLLSSFTAPRSDSWWPSDLKAPLVALLLSLLIRKSDDQYQIFNTPSLLIHGTIVIRETLQSYLKLRIFFKICKGNGYI
jgi:hypothetical protein